MSSSEITSPLRSFSILISKISLFLLASYNEIYNSLDFFVSCLFSINKDSHFFSRIEFLVFILDIYSLSVRYVRFYALCVTVEANLLTSTPLSDNAFFSSPFSF